MYGSVVSTTQQDQVVEELIIAPTPSRGSATKAHADSQRAGTSLEENSGLPSVRSLGVGQGC